MDAKLQAQIAKFKENPVFSPASAYDATEKSYKKEVKSFYYGFILYPDEDPDHKKMLNYCTTRTFYKYVYILHDRDKKIDEDGNVVLKKPHIHLVIKLLNRRTPSSVVKWFGGWIDHAEPIYEPLDYLLYLLHCSPEKLEDPLCFQYSPSDFRGTESLWKNLTIQNSHFVQLREVLFYQPFGGTFVDTFSSLPDDRKADLGEFMWENRFFVKSILDQEATRYFEVPVLAENNELQTVRSHLYSGSETNTDQLNFKEII